MKQLIVNGQAIDPRLVGYVDLNYRVQGGAKRVVVGLAADEKHLRQRKLNRLFFTEEEAESIKNFFTQPDNLNSGVVVFHG